jgi:hypothetical protein
MSFFDSIGKEATKIGKNPVLKDFLAHMGFGKSSETKSAEENLEKARQAYEGLDTPDLTEEHPEYVGDFDQTPSEMGTISVDPSYKEAQMEQLAALSNLAKGGRNASSDYALAKIQGDEGARAKGSRDAVMANMNARGMGGSGADLVAQLASNQAAQSDANMQDLGVMANQQNAAINAGNAAANIGSGLNAQDFQQQAAKAQAADAINRFNVSNKIAANYNNVGINNAAQQFNTGLEQTEYQNKVQKQAGIAGANMGAVGFNQNQANIAAQQAGGLMSGGVQMGTAAMAKGGAGGAGAGAAGGAGAGTAAAGGGAAAGGASMAGEGAMMAAMAARGGKIPGDAPFEGDTTLNDIVPIKASPGEVMVPRTLAKHGSPMEIASFVKHPPKVPMQDHDKEAMLSALHNIRRKRMG